MQNALEDMQQQLFDAKEAVNGCVGRAEWARFRESQAPELEAASAMGEVTIAGEGALLLDAYSLGRILEQMLLGTTPDGDGVQDASCCGRSAGASPARRKPPSSRQSSSPAPSSGPIPFVARRDASTLSAAARELIDALMHPDPEKRMAVAAATRSPFFVVGGERV